LPSDTDGATVISCNHKLNRFVFGQGDETCVVDHEVVVSAVLEWFVFEVAVDVVLYLGSAGGVNII
jgi:hypothetical protein